MARQQERSENTRRTLLKAFRAAFLKRGFDRTTTQQVLADTGLSKGALYHHFRSKTEIAEAIYAAESRRSIKQAISVAEQHPTPLGRLRAACMAWTEEARAPATSKVLFEIGPAAIGMRRAKEIEDAISLPHIENLLQAAINAGDIQLQNPALFGAMLNALVAETALFSLRNHVDPGDMLSDTLNALFNGMRAE